MILDVEFIENSKEINAEFESVIVAGGDPEASYNKGYDAGKQAEYDNFWDKFQNYGERNGYQYAFAYGYWNENIFKPKYNLVATDGSFMFYYNRSSLNIKTALENAGVVLDTSGATNVQNMFCRCGSPELPTIDLSSATDTTRMFYSEDIITIEKVIFSENTVIASNIFNGLTGLENIEIGGEICSDIAFSACTKLSLDSLKSIINHLKDYSGTDKEFTCKLTLASASKTLLENEGATAPNGLTWLEYAEYGKSWTI